MDGGGPLARIARQSVLPNLGQPAAPREPAPGAREDWLDMLRPALAERSPHALRIAEAALRARPADSALLLIAALAALVAEQPDRAIGFMTSSAKRRAVSCIICCSSVSSKLTILLPRSVTTFDLTTGERQGSGPLSGPPTE